MCVPQGPIGERFALKVHARLCAPVRTKRKKIQGVLQIDSESSRKFPEDGGYEIRQASDAEQPIFYRFQKPADIRYPEMVEFFARAPDGLQPAEAVG